MARTRSASAPKRAYPTTSAPRSPSPASPTRRISMSEGSPFLPSSSGKPRSGADRGTQRRRRRNLSAVAPSTASRSRAPLGPPVSLRSPEDDERKRSAEERRGFNLRDAERREAGPSRRRRVRGDGAAGVFDDHSLKTLAHRVFGGEADAVVIGQTAQEDALHAQIAQQARQPRRRPVVVLIEAGIGIDRRIIALADHGQRLV